MPEQNQEQYYEEPRQSAYPMNYNSEEEIKNIVGQIDPAHILDNLNHALKGEYFNKEQGVWEKVGDELVNTACRGWIVSYFTSIMNNASTMGIISEKQFSFLMEGIINTIAREFRCNLEKFGFVEKGSSYAEGDYQNKGTPDTSRMTSINEMILQRAFIVYSRSIAGSENKRVFKSLTMADQGGYGQPQEKKGWISKALGR